MKVSADAYFAMTPEWIIDTASANAVKLYGILRRYADKTEDVATPSRRALATRMGFSRPQSVDPAIAELVELGALQVTARHSDRGDQDSNEYLLISVKPAHIVRARRGGRGDFDGIEMWVVSDDPADAPRAENRTGVTTAEADPDGALQRTPPSAEKRTGGGAAERTTVVRESAHKPESPNQSPSPADAGEGARKRATTRGTRIPEPFIVNRDMRLWAAEEVPGLDVDVSTRMFVDHFRGSSGRNATKRDWEATWRNWLRRDHQQARGRPGGRESSLDRLERQRAETAAELAAGTPTSLLELQR